MAAKHGSSHRPAGWQRWSVVHRPARAEGLPAGDGSGLRVRVGDKPEDMTTGPPSADERKRTRNAASFFVVGVLLLLWAWGSWIYRTGVTGSELVVARMDPSEQTVEPAEVVRTIPLFLLVGLLLVLAFLLGSYVLVRTSRRYRMRRWRSGRSAGGGPAPTPVDDVWAMHKLPDDADDRESTFGNSSK